MMNLAVLIVVGIIIADILNNATQTNTILQTTAGIWTSAVNGMLGQPTGAAPAPKKAA